MGRWHKARNTGRALLLLIVLSLALAGCSASARAGDKSTEAAAFPTAAGEEEVSEMIDSDIGGTRLTAQRMNSVRLYHRKRKLC